MELIIWAWTAYMWLYLVPSCLVAIWRDES
jgi:hypothetical protein